MCTAPSKTFNLAGLQTSNLFVPNEELRKKLRDRLRALHFEAPNLAGLTACMAAYREGAAWLDELLAYLRGNTDFVRAFLANRLPALRLTEPEGTYLLWIDCRGLGLSDEALGELLTNRARVWIDDGPMFGPGGEGFIRVNAACPRAVLEKAFARIAEAVGK